MNAKRVLQLLRAALEVPHADRAAWIDSHCADDPATAAELRALLAEDAERGASSSAMDSLAARIATDAGPVDLSGTTLGEFRLVARVGEGGSAIVYVAEHERLGRRVALKLMRRAWTLRSGEANFRHEARALARLRHEHVAVVYDYGLHTSQDPLGRAHSVPWLAVELVEDARPIFVVARDAPLDRKVELLVQACRGLAAAHQALIEHGDVSSANVLVDRNGRVKVVDFGLARLEAEVGERTSTAVCGNLPYLAPELLQARDDQPISSARRDVFSFGMVMLEVLSGVPATELRGATSELAEFGRREVPRLDRVAPSLPKDLAWIVAKATALDPATRYRSADLVLDDLERFQRDEPVSVGAREWSYIARKFAARHPWHIATVVAAITALGISGSWGIDHLNAAERDRMNSAYMLTLERLMSGIIGAFDPSGESAEPLRLDPNDRPLLRIHRDQLIESEVGDAERLIGLLARIGNTLRARGDFEDAEPALRRASELAVEHFGEDSRAWAEREHDLAILAHAREHLTVAEPHLRAAYSTLERLAGAAADRTRHMRDDLAELLMVEPARWDEAEALLRANVELTAAAPAKEHARAWQRLGTFFLVSHRLDAAADAIDRGTLDELDPALAAERRAAAWVLRGKLAIARSDWPTARATFGEGVAAWKEVGARGLLKAADAQFGIAHALAAEERMEERLACVRDSIAIYAKLLDDDHPLALIARANLADVLSAAGHREECFVVLDEFLASIDRKFGPNSRRAMRESVVAVEWLLRDGSAREASCYLAQALDARRRGGLPLDHDAARAAHAAYGVRAALGDREGALRWALTAAVLTRANASATESAHLDALADVCASAAALGRRELTLAAANALARKSWTSPERAAAADAIARTRRAEALAMR
ncbi:MAG: serine/threonine protein kinase [Planctomycetes bacterium]|nr:serine/threonine protein kinase [Planctomycetota bacterium]